MDSVKILFDKIIANLEKIHVAGRNEQMLMISAIDALEKLKTAIIVEKNDEKDSDINGDNNSWFIKYKSWCCSSN